MNFQTTFLGGQLDRALVGSLPCLPGYNFNLNIGADKFNKPGHWGFNKDVRILNEVEGFRPRPGIGADVPERRTRPGIGGCLLPPWAPVRTGPDHSVFPKGHGSKYPTWLEYDKMVLAFDGYFQEPIPESGIENYRIHQCKLYFYLEDDTVQVIEPKTHNSGIPQGQVIRRHRIPLPEPCSGQYYTLEHFNVGCEVMLYGKAFHVTGCDGFTRMFLNRLGIPVPHNTELPLDMATETLKDRKTSQFARKPHHCHDTRGPFLLHSDHVLRFWTYWDDRCKLYGDLRHFVLHYFLSDDTIEIQEILKPNSGYEAYPLFLRRSKVPKNPERLVGLPGEKTPLTILNVFGSMYATKNKRAHWIVDNLGTANAPNEEFYTAKDLAIGAVINIYGRPFILTACDTFTQEYYKEKFGVENFTPLELNEEDGQEIPAPKPPPYHGWGQEDDLGMWNSLEMKPAVKDYRKEAEMEKDILRFEAKFYDALQSVNRSRRFVINYYMADETMQVFEAEHPNSGLPQGRFLARRKIKKPGHQYELGEDPEFYETKDLYIGNIININGYQFQLINSDEFTLSYMEANKHLFPHSNICIVLEKFREAVGPLEGDNVLQCFADNDTCRQGVIDTRGFRTLLLQISKCGLSEHEVLTLTRAYAAKSPPPGVDWPTVQAIAQTELRRFLFDRILLARIEYTCRYHDPCRTGRVDRETLRATLKGAKVPIFYDLLDFMVDKFPSPKDDLCNRVDYCEFMRFLDWETNPAPIAKPAAIQCVLRWVEPKQPLKVQCVNYKSFLEDVAPNIQCSYPSVCCCCPSKPCPQHCSNEEEVPDYCPKDECGKQELPPCPPTEPVTVHLRPCSITMVEGDSHTCAPGSQKCFLNQGQDEERETCVPTVPIFNCAPCNENSGNSGRGICGGGNCG